MHCKSIGNVLSNNGKRKQFPNVFDGVKYK